MQSGIIRVFYDREQGEFAPMATVTRKRYTPADLLKITDRPMPELIDGELVERELMGQEADAIGMRVGALLIAYSGATLPGLVNGSEGSFQVFPDDPKKVRIPDVSFTRLDRIPGGKPAKGHGRVAPDLAVEVISPNDKAAKVFGKIRDFLDAGVPMIWAVNPGTRDVLVLRADGTATLLKVGDTLDGGAVLPGFSCPVAALFE